MSSNNRKFNRSKKINQGWSAKEKSAFILIGITVLSFGILISNIVFKNFDGSADSDKNYIVGVVPDSLVCMSDNSIKSKTTGSISFEGKTYMGCCSECRLKLFNNENNVQFAVDPFSGKKVNKSDAIVYADPVNIGKVLYFESDENYLEFISLNIKK